MAARGVSPTPQAGGEAGLATRVSFEVASAADFHGTDYGLVTIFDALHDVPDPLGVAKHIGQVLKVDGTLLLVEPMAGDRIEDNFNPVGRLYHGPSSRTPCRRNLGPPSAPKPGRRG